MFSKTQCSTTARLCFATIGCALIICFVITTIFRKDVQATISDLKIRKDEHYNDNDNYNPTVDHDIYNATAPCTNLNSRLNNIKNSNNTHTPSWSNPTVINIDFGILYFSRVPKTGTRTWRDRNYDVGEYLNTINNTNNQSGLRLQCILMTEKSRIFRTTFVAANRYQKYAKWAANENIISTWANEFFPGYYLLLNKIINSAKELFLAKILISNNTSNVISDDEKYHEKYHDDRLYWVDTNDHFTSLAHFPFIDDFEKLNDLWFDYLNEKIRGLKINLNSMRKDENYIDAGFELELEMEFQLELQLLQYFLQNKNKPFQVANSEIDNSNIDIVNGNINSDININISHLTMSYLQSHSNINFINSFQISIPNAKIRVTWIIYFRDPITHQISRFDYWRRSLSRQYRKHPTIYSMTFEQCVDMLEWKKDVDVLSIDQQSKIGMQSDSSSMMDEYLYNPCYLSINYFTRWLCGIGDDCMKLKLDNQSLTRAIFNLDTYFDFVGVVEYYEESWKFLAMKFPIFGVKKFVDDDHTNKKHVPLSQGTFDKLTEWSNLDVRLYNYVKTRFETCILPHVISTS